MQVNVYLLYLLLKHICRTLTNPCGIYIGLIARQDFLLTFLLKLYNTIEKIHHKSSLQTMKHDKPSTKLTYNLGVRNNRSLVHFTITCKGTIAYQFLLFVSRSKKSQQGHILQKKIIRPMKLINDDDILWIMDCLSYNKLINKHFKFLQKRKLYAYKFYVVNYGHLIVIRFECEEKFLLISVYQTTISNNLHDVPGSEYRI